MSRIVSLGIASHLLLAGCGDASGGERPSCSSCADWIVQLEVSIFGLDVGPDGEVWVCGIFGDPLTIGAFASPSDDGAFVARFDAAGNPTFAAFGSETEALGTVLSPARRVAVARDGSAYVAGELANPMVDVFGEQLTDEETLYLVKFASDGAVQWRRQFSTSRNGGVTLSLGMLPDGNVMVTGRYDSQSMFGDVTVDTPSARSPFWIVYSPDGDVVGSAQFPASSSSWFGWLAVGDRSIWITADIDSAIDVAGTTVGADMMATEAVLQLGFDGRLESVTELREEFLNLRGVAPLGDGAVVVGSYTRPVTVGGVALEIDATQMDQGVVLRVDGAGNVQWVTPFRHANTEFPVEVAVLADGTIMACGNSVGGTLERYDETGAYLGREVWGDSPRFDQCEAIDVDPFGGTVIAGTFAGSIEIGGELLVAVGESSAFVWRRSDLD